jgi:hypothetical protein
MTMPGCQTREENAADLARQAQHESVRFYMDLRVYEREAVYAAARTHAIEVDGVSPSEADELLKPAGEIDLSACIVMLFDPGLSPVGLEILQSGLEP